MERAISNNELREAVDFSRMRGQRSVVEWHCSINWSLKGQYPVTAHAPNFDFQTGCRKIKRCEEKKRTLKNPFASRFAEFNTTLKLLMITDQWYIVPVKPRFGLGRDFCGVTFIVVGRRSKWWKALWCEDQTDKLLTKKGRARSLKLLDEFFMVMCGVRQGFPEDHLANLFNVSTPTVSRIFITLVNFMYFKFGQINNWMENFSVPVRITQHWRAWLVYLLGEQSHLSANFTPVQSRIEKL